MRLLAHLALVHLILELSTPETVSTPTIDLHHLHLVFRRHGFELGTDVERVFFGLTDYTAVVNI